MINNIMERFKNDEYIKAAAKRQRKLRYSDITQHNYQKLRLHVLTTEGRCRTCWEERGKLVTPTIMDHIVPLFEGGKNEISNLQPLCRDCHDLKTKLELGQTIGSCVHGVLEHQHCPKCERNNT